MSKWSALWRSSGLEVRSSELMKCALLFLSQRRKDAGVAGATSKVATASSRWIFLYNGWKPSLLW